MEDRHYLCRCECGFEMIIRECCLKSDNPPECPQCEGEADINEIDCPTCAHA